MRNISHAYWSRGILVLIGSPILVGMVFLLFSKATALLAALVCVLFRIEPESETDG